jgi:hypothetical protein
MTAAKITELHRGSAHRRQVEYVRASLLRGVEYRDKPARRTTTRT